MTEMRVGVDVGGTFTDFVAVTGGRVITAKVPSTEDQSEGVLRSVDAAGIDRESVAVLAHGTTVATNALLERKGARVALVTTHGFRDVIEIGRQNRPSLYDLTLDRPPPLVPRELRFAVRERMGPDGEIVPLDEAAVIHVTQQLSDCDVDAVAICFLFSYLHPEHEQRAASLIRQGLPQLPVSLSCEVLPEFREYERFATTVANAYLAPKLSAYLSRLAERTSRAELPTPLVMQSSGGVMSLHDASDHAAACVLSGPAGGVVGAAFVASASGYEDVLTFDMGGTSTDVAPILSGEVRTTTEGVIGGVPIKLPMADVHTVGAGGGSIAWVDAGGALRVGPQSAGALPGPACYGKGGTDATVTDADLYLGYMRDGAVIGAEVTLDRALAAKAIDDLARAIDLDPVETARGITRVAEIEMARALKVVSVDRGVDPRGLALVAFGGAGPMHACALAEELEMGAVLVPKASGVLSALGLAISDLRRDLVSPLLAPLSELMAERVEEGFRRLESEVDMADPLRRRRADLRYRGQSFELTVDTDDWSKAGQQFHAAHEQRYGYRMDDEIVEVVNLRLTATQATAPPRLQEPVREGTPRTGRRVNVDGDWREIDVWQRDRLGAGSRVRGPAIVEMAEATAVVRPGWEGGIDERGMLVLERIGAVPELRGRKTSLSETSDPRAL